jgi:glycosyltransferase involved in cell wall biosynthesis
LTTRARVLHVAETLRGGTASYLDEVVPTQVDAASVHLLVPASQAGELRACRGLDVRGYDDATARVRRVPRLAAAYLRLHAALQPDLVHVHGTYAGVAVRLAHRAALHRSRLVYCAHGWAFDREVPRWQRNAAAGVERMLAHAADAIVCISDHDRRSALGRGLPARRLVTLRNAIGAVPDAPASDVAWPDGRRRVLFVGRFDRQKGVDVLLEAMRTLDRRAFAWLAGSPVVAAQAIGALPGNVGIAGWLDRAALQAYYASADVVVVPSRWEGFGLVALEAMRARRAVVASAVGGLPELVEDGASGLLVEPGCARSLARAILAPDADRLREMGERGHARWREAFTLPRLGDELLGLYARLLEAGRVEAGVT